MSLLPVSAIPVVEGGYNINNSLRFRSSASANLSRTPSTTTRRTMTFSFWVKRGSVSADNYIVNATTDATASSVIYFNNSNSGTLDVFLRNASTNYSLTTTQVFRDPSAWYHIVVAIDTTKATASDRTKVYVNGSQVTSFLTASYIPQNTQLAFGNTVAHYIGGNASYLDGYLAEFYYVSGQQLTPSSFGETDTTTGVWKPKAYTGTYGTNGFYLKFSDATGTPTLINTATAVQNTSSTTITVNVPAGTTNNDLMILVATTGVSTQTAPWTTPSGWTLWGNNGGRTVFYKTASSEPASYTLTHSVSSTLSACILTYRNAAIDVFGTYSANASPSDAPSITTTANNAVVLDYVAGRTNASTTYTTPTNFTSLVADSDATQPSYAVFSRVQATAGATGTASSTPSSGTAVSVQFSIKPISNTNLGLDYSGNGNNWTTNNISVTAGVTYDAMTDSPTLTSATVANYPTLNPLAMLSGTTSATFSNGNLQVTSVSTGDSVIPSTMSMTGSGKYYAEFTAGTASIYGDVGIINITHPTLTAIGDTATSYNYRSNGNKNNNSTQTAYGASYTTNDVIGVAFDVGAGTIEFYKNNVSQGVAYTGINSSESYLFACGDELAAGTFIWTANFGQIPFTYTPPTGFKALNTYNLPNSTILKGNNFMDAQLWSGNGTNNRAITQYNFYPDFTWIKQRSSNYFHVLSNSVAGVNRALNSNSTNAETTNGIDGYTSAFSSTGFTLTTGTTSINNVNQSGQTYVGWAWNANNGSSVSNTSGTITSTVSVNATAGFSIVTYTGNGSATASVGHGLGVAPKVVIIKARSTTGNWAFYTSAVDGSWDVFNLNTTATKSDSTATAPTSSVFNLITAGSLNTNAVTYVAYCWAEIAGFSRFGSYIGNGNANGPFVYLGFRPKFILTKISSGTADNWTIMDSSREVSNAASTIRAIEPDTANAEFNNANTGVDLLSNGFKIRNTWAQQNTSGSTYIYAAFAENPFKYSLAR